MNADPVARIYRTLEYLAFGRALERCRYSLVAPAATAKHILILGEGDGRFLARLLARNAQAQVDVVESSERMLALARTRVAAPDLPRVRFLHQDALDGLPALTYDAIVTNFFLDCLTADEARQFIRSTVPLLDPHGCWLVSDFHLPAAGIRRWHAKLWLTVMYRFFALTTDLRAYQIPDYPAEFASAGLLRLDQQFWRGDLLTAERYGFFSDDLS